MPEPQQTPPVFGRYKDPVMLGSGGMGAVYRAIDPMLDRYVAIKVLTHREPRYLERFRREAQVLAKIMHPSIIQIYEIVGSDEGQSDPYIVMEFFQGRPLDAR
jgi:eukaryotic-like serine/threonine-protein kinase